MTPVELDVLADKVAERLNMPLISAAIPEHVGQLLSTVASFGPMHMHWIPLTGPNGINTEWKVNSDASLTLRLMDSCGQLFWQGTFRAVPAKKVCPCGQPDCWTQA